MHYSIPALAGAASIAGSIKFGRWYLNRLDREQQNGPEEARRKIIASRRRAQGHLWLGGAVLATVFIFALALGAHRPAFGPKVALFFVLLGAAVIFCGFKSKSAYADVHRTSEQRSQPGHVP
jgi:hypothetical protein